MGIRGFARGVYTTDDGAQFALMVDADYAVAPERGWTLDDPAVLPLLPRQFLPRRVVGIDEEGRQATAVAPSVVVPIWTRSSPTFEFWASDELLHTATIVASQQERSTPHARFR